MVDHENSYIPEEISQPASLKYADVPSVNEQEVEAMKGSAVYYAADFFQGKREASLGYADNQLVLDIKQQYKQAKQTDPKAPFEIKFSSSEQETAYNRLIEEYALQIAAQQRASQTMSEYLGGTKELPCTVAEQSLLDSLHVQYQQKKSSSPNQPVKLEFPDKEQEAYYSNFVQRQSAEIAAVTVARRKISQDFLGTQRLDGLDAEERKLLDKTGASYRAAKAKQPQSPVTLKFSRQVDGDKYDNLVSRLAIEEKSLTTWYVFKLVDIYRDKYYGLPNDEKEWCKQNLHTGILLSMPFNKRDAFPGKSIDGKPQATKQETIDMVAKVESFLRTKGWI